MFLLLWILLIFSCCPLSHQVSVCTGTASNEFGCRSTLVCIPGSWMCDYYYDCSDNTDEDDPDICPFPSADMSTAVIYSVNGGSSHLINLFGDPDQYGPMFGNSLLANSLPLRYTGRLGNTTNTFGPTTVDYRTQIVYYGNNNQGLIQYGHLVYNNVTGLNYYQTLPVTTQISSLAFDWAAKNLYWIDGEYKFIAVLRDDGTITPPWKVVVSDLSYPKDVAVCPPNRRSLGETCEGLMFWSDGNDISAKIERSDLSGNSRVVLVNSTQGLVDPTTLVIDVTSQRLYWLDAAAGTLGAVNFDGSNVTTWSRTAFSGFSTMTISGNIIFFGDYNRSRVHVYNKINVTTFGYKEFLRASGPIADMVMFAADSQPTSQNPCTVENGNCVQLCFATTSSRICGCTNGLVLSVDGLSCEISPFSTSKKLLFLSDFNQWHIYQLQPKTGEIRVLAIKSYPIALTVDTTLNFLYFIFKDNTDNKYRIRRRSFDGQIDESIFTASTAISRLAGLALDNTRGLLYYTDSYLGVVGELSTNGLQSRIIFQAFEEFPRAIAVDSRSSRLYWTDCSPSPSTPSIQTSRVDGTDRRTLINGSAGSCFTGLALAFIKQVMYFSTSTTIETSSLNGSQRTTVYNKSGVDLSALTIMDDSLIIADRNQRIPVKYNLTTRNLVPMQLPPSSAIFTNISDVKFFDFNPGVKYYCRIVIANLIFRPQYSNQSTPEYQTLFNRINPSLASVYMRTLGAVFLYIDDIRFSAGSGTVVYNDIQLTSLPSDQMINGTLAAIPDELISASLLMTDVDLSSMPFHDLTQITTMTMQTSTTPTASDSFLTGIAGKQYCFRIIIANMAFVPPLRNQTTTEYQTLSSRTNALLTPIFTRILGTTFVGIVNIRFSPGSVIAFVDIQVTREPNDQTINITKMALINGMAADSLLVTDVSMSLDRYDAVTTETFTNPPTTGSQLQTSHHISASPRSMVIGLAVGLTLGVLFLLALVIALSIVYYMRCRSNPSDTTVEKPPRTIRNIYQALRFRSDRRSAADDRSRDLPTYETVASFSVPTTDRHRPHPENAYDNGPLSLQSIPDHVSLSTSHNATSPVSVTTSDQHFPHPEVVYDNGALPLQSIPDHLGLPSKQNITSPNSKPTPDCPRPEDMYDNGTLPQSVVDHLPMPGSVTSPDYDNVGRRDAVELDDVRFPPLKQADSSVMLVDNSFYEKDESPLGSNGDYNVTVIDNSLYEKESQSPGQPLGSNGDYDVTVIDNSLYETGSPSSRQPPRQTGIMMSL